MNALRNDLYKGKLTKIKYNFSIRLWFLTLIGSWVNGNGHDNGSGVCLNAKTIWYVMADEIILYVSKHK